jgi:AcrR family transcriptional regulator
MKTDKEMNTKAEKNIVNAFLRLYQEKDLNEITVKEICQRAGVSRVTFYTYFEDIPTLLSGIEEKMLNDVDEIGNTFRYIDLAKLGKNTPIPILVNSYMYMEENIEVFRALLGPHGSPQFFRRFDDHFKQSCLENIKTYKTDTFSPDILASFCVGAVKSVGDLWVLGKIKATPEELALMSTKVIIAILNCDI